MQTAWAIHMRVQGCVGPAWALLPGAKPDPQVLPARGPDEGSSSHWALAALMA